MPQEPGLGSHQQTPLPIVQVREQHRELHRELVKSLVRDAQGSNTPILRRPLPAFL